MQQRTYQLLNFSQSGHRARQFSRTLSAYEIDKLVLTTFHNVVVSDSAHNTHTHTRHRRRTAHSICLSLFLSFDRQGSPITLICPLAKYIQTNRPYREP